MNRRSIASDGAIRRQRPAGGAPVLLATAAMLLASIRTTNTACAAGNMHNPPLCGNMRVHRCLLLKLRGGDGGGGGGGGAGGGAGGVGGGADRSGGGGFEAEENEFLSFMEDIKGSADPPELQEGEHLYVAKDRTGEDSLIDERNADVVFPNWQEPQSPLHYEAPEQSTSSFGYESPAQSDTSSFGEDGEKSAPPKERSEDTDTGEVSEQSEDDPEIESLREKLKEEVEKEGLLDERVEPWPWHEHDIGDRKWTQNEILDEMRRVAAGMEDDDYKEDIDPIEYEPDYGTEPYIGTDEEIMADPVGAWERWNRLVGMPGGLCSWRSVFERYVPSYLRPNHPIFDGKADRLELELNQMKKKELNEMWEREMQGDRMVTDDDEDRGGDAEFERRRAELAKFMQLVEKDGLELAIEKKKEEMFRLPEAMTGMPTDLELQEKKHEEESLSAQELHEMAQKGVSQLEEIQRQLMEGDFDDKNDDDGGNNDDDDDEVVGAKWNDPEHESEDVERLIEPGCEDDLDKFIDKVTARVPEPAGETGRFVGPETLGVDGMMEKIGQNWKESLADYERVRGDQEPPAWLGRGEEGGLAGVYDTLWGEPTASDRAEALKGCNSLERKLADGEEALGRLWRRCDRDVEKMSKAVGNDPDAPWEIHAEAKMKRERREAGLPDLYDSDGECCPNALCGMNNLNLDLDDVSRVEPNPELVSHLGINDGPIHAIPEENIFGRMVGVDGTEWQFADVYNRTKGNPALRKELRDEWNSFDGGEFERFAWGNLDNTASGVQRDLRIRAMDDLNNMLVGGPVDENRVRVEDKMRPLRPVKKNKTRMQAAGLVFTLCIDGEEFPCSDADQTLLRYHLSLQSISLALNSSGLWHDWVGPAFLCKNTSTVSFFRALVRALRHIDQFPAEWEHRLPPRGKGFGDFGAPEGMRDPEWDAFRDFEKGHDEDAEGLHIRKAIRDYMYGEDDAFRLDMEQDRDEETGKLFRDEITAEWFDAASTVLGVTIELLEATPRGAKSIKFFPGGRNQIEGAADGAGEIVLCALGQHVWSAKPMEVGKAWTFRGRCEEIQDHVGLHDCEGNKVDLYERLKEAERWIQGSTPEQKERRRWAEDMFRGAARVAMADGNKAAFDYMREMERCEGEWVTDSQQSDEAGGVSVRSAWEDDSGPNQTDEEREEERDMYEKLKAFKNAGEGEGFLGGGDAAGKGKMSMGNEGDLEEMLAHIEKGAWG